MGAIDTTCNMMYLAILLLLSVSLSVDAKRDCQKSGSSMCASSDPAMAGIPLKPCCKKFVCQENPEMPTGDMFCMERDPIPEMGNCKGMRGLCEEGTKCKKGVCVAKPRERFLGLLNCDGTILGEGQHLSSNLHNKQ